MDTSPYLANVSPSLATNDSRKSLSPLLCQWGYRDFVQVLSAICSVQVPAGRRINFEDLAFASKVILRQNTSGRAICQLCLPFPLNNFKILGKGLIIPLNPNHHHFAWMRLRCHCWEYGIRVTVGAAVGVLQPV